MTGKKIVIIDDDIMLLDEMKESLALSGYDVASTHNSLEALDLVKSNMPDLVILDIKMNGMNGFQIADSLNQAPETSRIPLIAITGYFNKEEHLKLMRNYGIRLCLNKPFSQEDLLYNIRQLFENSAKTSA